MAQPSKPLKSGDFAVSVAEDPVLWTDRKRVLGLPLSFTRYSLTANKLVLNTGFMSLHEEEVRLYRVRDISLTRTLGERLFGVGTVLPGVTRRSIIELCKDWGYEVVEGKLAIADIMQAGRDGKLEEVFGTGTAAVVSPV